MQLPVKDLLILGLFLPFGRRKNKLYISVFMSNSDALC